MCEILLQHLFFRTTTAMCFHETDNCEFSYQAVQHRVQIAWMSLPQTAIQWRSNGLCGLCGAQGPPAVRGPQRAEATFLPTEFQNERMNELSKTKINT